LVGNLAGCCAAAGVAGRQLVAGQLFEADAEFFSDLNGRPDLLTASEDLLDFWRDVLE
jgi:hypothetical protein